MAVANYYGFTTSKAAFSTAAAQTVLQVAAPSLKSIEIVRVSVGQETSTTSTQLGVLLYRTAAAVTWTSPTTLAAANITRLNPSDAATGCVVTAWGTTVTDGTTPAYFLEETFNILNGYLFLPVPEERPVIAAAGFLAVKLMGVVPSATWTINVVAGERG